MRLTILVDMDGIIVDLLTPWLTRINNCCGQILTKDDITTWHMPEVKCPHVFKFLDESLFLNAPAIPYAIQTLKTWADTHDVLLLTAPAPDPKTASAKLVWVQNHLGWGRERVILTSRKELVFGDVLIDDKPSTLLEYKRAWPNALLMTIDYVYTRDAQADVIAPFETAWKPGGAFDNAIKELSKT